MVIGCTSLTGKVLFLGKHNKLVGSVLFADDVNDTVRLISKAKNLNPRIHWVVYHVAFNEDGTQELIPYLDRRWFRFGFAGLESRVARPFVWRF